MRPSKFLLVIAVALMAFAGCSDDVDEPTNQNQNNDYDDFYYAKNASISSSDYQFTVTDDGVVISFGASGGEVVVNIDCGTEWTAKNNAEDIFGCTIQSKSVTITAEQNPVGEELTGTITLMTAKKNIEFATITVTQAGQAYVKLSPEELSLPNIGSTTTVTVESNYDWDYSYDTTNDWFSVEKDKKNGSLSITYSKNETGSDREGVVTVTAGDGDKNVAEAELKIIQSWENRDALILEFTITDNNVTIWLTISDYSNITVDWDDGTTDNARYHKYSTPGIYTVTINGIIHCIDSHTVFDSNFVSSLTAVKQWGNTGLTSMKNAFYDCSSLKSVPEDSSGAFKDVTTFYRAFYRCSSLESAPSFEGCSKTTTFEAAFYGCKSLPAVPESMFSGCTAVTTFYQAFYNCSSLKSAPSFKGCGRINLGETFYGCKSMVTVPENMFSGCSPSLTKTFYNCSSLTTIPENMLLVSEVRAITYCFYGCSGLTAIPSGLFDNCTAVTSFQSCFYDCSGLTAIPSGLFDNCTGVTDFSDCFYGCSGLTAIPAGLFDNCPDVTDFVGCFCGCSGLTSIPENLFAGCTAVTNFSWCFDKCYGLTSIPENLFASCTAVTDFSYCFRSCTELTDVPPSIFDNNRAVTNFSYTFLYCSSVSGESPYTEIEVDGEKVKVHLYERSGNYAAYMRCSVPTSYSGCFRDSTFSDYSSVPSGWK